MNDHQLTHLQDSDKGTYCGLPLEGYETTPSPDKTTCLDCLGAFAATKGLA